MKKDKKSCFISRLLYTKKIKLGCVSVNKGRINMTSCESINFERFPATSIKKEN